MASPGRGLPARGLLVRVASAAVIVAGILALILAGGVGVYVLAALVLATGLGEFRGLAQRIDWAPPVWILFPLAAAVAFGGGGAPRPLVDGGMTLIALSGLALFLVSSDPRRGLGRWATAIVGALYLGLPIHFLLLIYASQPVRGVAWILITVTAVAAGDAAALLVGVRWGRHPFFARTSPNKTVEGAIAGLLLPMLLFAALGAAILRLPVAHGLALGLLVGLGAETGDLAESQLKRVVGVKDSSNWIPGHGGVLDRIDSALLPAAIVYFYAVLWHLLSR